MRVGPLPPHLSNQGGGEREKNKTLKKGRRRRKRRRKKRRRRRRKKREINKEGQLGMDTLTPSKTIQSF